MKRIISILTLVISLALPSLALADGSEEVSVVLNPTPAGALYKDVFRPIDWRVETLVTSTDPGVYPMKRAVLDLGSNTIFKPNNQKTPICPDSQVGPINGVGIPIPALIARCPTSIIGNGRAIFQLGRLNTEAAKRDGLILIFNGGYTNGNPKLKIMAFSYDTGAGVYVEGVLENGQISFDIPVLTADSAVTSLNLNIPGEDESVYLPAQEKTVFLPGGLDSSYSQARCPSGTLDLGASFDLGTRNTAGQPTSDTLVKTASSSVACTGLAGAVRILNPQVSGPSRVKLGKKTTYRVTLKNTGTKNSSSGKLTVSGKGVSFSSSAISIRAESSKTISVPLKFKKKGAIKVKFSYLGKTTIKKVTVS